MRGIPGGWWVCPPCVIGYEKELVTCQSGGHRSGARGMIIKMALVIESVGGAETAGWWSPGKCELGFCSVNDSLIAWSIHTFFSSDSELNLSISFIIFRFSPGVG